MSRQFSISTIAFLMAARSVSVGLLIVFSASSVDAQQLNYDYGSRGSIADQAIAAAEARRQGQNLPPTQILPPNTYDWRTRQPWGYHHWRCPVCGFTNCRCGYPRPWYYSPYYSPAWQYGYQQPYYSNYLGLPTYYNSWYTVGTTVLPAQVPALPVVVNPLPPINLPRQVPAQVPVVAAAKPAAGEPVGRIAQRAALLRQSNATARGRADILIDAGDKFFADRNYRRASLRYEEAIKAAPDYSRSRFRLAQALAALDEHDRALEEYLLALELVKATDPAYEKLSQIYGEHQAAFENQLEFISNAALRRPNDGGLLMLVGLTLYFDQQTDRARPFFEQAANMPGNHQPYAKRFLPADPPAAAQPAAAPVPAPPPGLIR